MCSKNRMESIYGWYYIVAHVAVKEKHIVCVRNDCKAANRDYNQSPIETQNIKSAA